MSSASGKTGLVKLLGGLDLERFSSSMRADLRFAPLNAFLLVLLFVAGLIVHLNTYDFRVEAVSLTLGSALILCLLLHLFQVWEAVVILGTADCLLLYLKLRPESQILLVTAIVALLVSCSIQIAYQWERSVVLRFGRFQALRKPGLFLLLPVIDKVAQFVDQRIRVTDFSAETTLTADTVPVNVDAIAFWMVWDAQKAVLEVEQFEDAMSRQAQAERERQSRIILGTAETEIAEKFARASEHYRNNPVALHLRAMNMVFEGLRQKGSMIIVPSTAVETMGLGALGGLTAFDRGSGSAGSATESQDDLPAKG